MRCTNTGSLWSAYHPDTIPKKAPRTRDGLLKYNLVRDVSALTKRAWGVEQEATSPRIRRHP